MITASIVTYNTTCDELETILNCAINSIIDKIYIIDNSPNDFLRKYANLHKKIIYIYGHGNVGYGSAHNIAIRHAELMSTTYHIILNPDISFNPADLKILKDFMDNDNSVGLLLPKVKYPDGQVQFLCKLLPTPLNLFLRRFIPITSIVKNVNKYYELKHFDYSHVLNVPCLSGCFMFIRSEVFKTVGLFDENFFMYAEDFDYSRRIHKVYKTCFVPYVTITHAHKKESYKNYKMLFIHVKSLIYYFNKWGWFYDLERERFNKSVMIEINKINSGKL